MNFSLSKSYWEPVIKFIKGYVPFSHSFTEIIPKPIFQYFLAHTNSSKNHKECYHRISTYLTIVESPPVQMGGGYKDYLLRWYSGNISIFSALCSFLSIFDSYS